MGSALGSDAFLSALLAGSCAWQGLENQPPLECMQEALGEWPWSCRP